MTIQISIVGLGQIGASIGLALAGKDTLLQRIGHDRDIQVARFAEKQGAVDQVITNLPRAVRDADIVILSLPVDQIQETMEIIASELKNNAVVMDTGPIKEAVDHWALELMSAERHYVGLTPVINPAYLHLADSGPGAARADLFRGGLMAIAAPQRTDSAAIKLAADLTRLLGATAFFVDPVEMDGLMAATHLLPQVLAAGLLNATIDQPGWREGRKVAGKAYAEATAPIVYLDDSNTLTTSVLLNRENMLRNLDSTIAALQAIRSDIESKDEASLKQRLERARVGRITWWQQREAGDWVGEEIPASNLADEPGILGRLFGIRRKSKTDT